MIVRHVVSACAALAAVAALAPAAQAQDLRLSYGDLDLSQPAGAQALDKRIDTAARQWCAGEQVTGSLMSPAGCVPTVKGELMASLPTRVRDAVQAARSSSRTASLAGASKGS